MDYQLLRTELDAGFPGSSDSVIPPTAYDVDNALAAEQLNATGAYTAWTRIVPHTWTDASTLYEALQTGSITDMTNPQRSRWDSSVVPLFNLQQFLARGNILGQLNAIWGSGSPEYVNYIAATQDIVSRAIELGLGAIHEQHIIVARSL